MDPREAQAAVIDVVRHERGIELRIRKGAKQIIGVLRDQLDGDGPRAFNLSHAERDQRGEAHGKSGSDPKQAGICGLCAETLDHSLKPRLEAVAELQQLAPFLGEAELTASAAVQSFTERAFSSF